MDQIMLQYLSFIIIHNKNMEASNQVIISKTIQYIIGKFLQKLKVKEIEAYSILANIQYVQRLTYQLICIDNLASYRSAGLQQQVRPNNIPIDHNSNFMCDICKVQPSKQQKSPVATIKTKINFHKNRKFSKSTNIQESIDHGLMILTEPIITQTQLKLQNEISEVQKQLYHKRKLNQDFQDQKRNRLQEIINRKHMQLPNKDFSFDYDGEFLFKTKPNFKKSLAISPKSKIEEQERQNLPKSELKMQSSNRDFFTSRGQTQSRETKRLLFANAGKRQISHLPFIKLNQNSKLSENKKSLSGIDINKEYTMKSNISRGETSFKHYTQLQKQESLRIFSLKKSQFSQATEDQPQEKIPLTHAEPHKLSKRMQKYLKKLYEDKSKECIDKLNKSENFDRLNSPVQYNVHRYYKHNFDLDKHNICQSSLRSYQLNRSVFRQVKYTNQ